MGKSSVNNVFYADAHHSPFVHAKDFLLAVCEKKCCSCLDLLDALKTESELMKQWCCHLVSEDILSLLSQLNDSFYLVLLYSSSL